jgi:hypothetical protein
MFCGGSQNPFMHREICNFILCKIDLGFLNFVVLLFFEIQSHCVARAGLVLIILLPQSPLCWDCHHTWQSGLF